MANVKVPSMLRPMVGGERVISAEGGTVRDLITLVDRSHPGFAAQLMDQRSGGLRSFVNVYLNDEDVRYLGGLDTPVEQADTVSILPAVAGGRG
ncbi:MAG: MoaD/ThiS family protein [Chloroflexi bacterium]|nr:MoaD/ThiS family protein [Chloroflexota bacterium]